MNKKEVHTLTINYKRTPEAKMKNDLNQVFENIIAPLNEIAESLMTDIIRANLRKQKYFKHTIKQNTNLAMSAISRCVEFAKRRIKTSSKEAYERQSEEERKMREALRYDIHLSYMDYFKDYFQESIDKLTETIKKNYIEHGCEASCADLLANMATVHYILRTTRDTVKVHLVKAEEACNKSFRDIFYLYDPSEAFERWDLAIKGVISVLPRFNINIDKQMDVNRAKEKFQNIFKNENYAAVCMAKAYTDYEDRLPEDYEVIRRYLVSEAEKEEQKQAI